MDAEVREMRGAVEKLNVQVDTLKESVDDMSEPLSEIGHTLHPLRRSGNQDREARPPQGSRRRPGGGAGPGRVLSFAPCRG